MKIYIVANWKCNPSTLKESQNLFNSVKRKIKNIKKAQALICPPFVYLGHLKVDNYSLQLGSQDCFWEEKGAFTGEISPLMLKDLGCQYVIIGHSERRKYLKETDEIINKKIKLALKSGLRAILCIDNIAQIKKDLTGLDKKEKNKLIIAYEPLFAIGTGKACSVEMARKMRTLINKKTNKNTPVLYGGSVNLQNAEDYIKNGGFQGLLIGGASLKPKEFAGIVEKIEKS